MKKKHKILTLPEDDAEFDKIVSDDRHDIFSIGFSSAVEEGKTKHYALIVWHDYEYGDHDF